MAAVAFVLSSLAACSTSDTLSVAGARNTGTFPNLNIPQKTAAEQISDDQKAAKLAQLQAAQQSQNAVPPGASADPVVLQNIAQNHADDALKQIEQK